MERYNITFRGTRGRSPEVRRRLSAAWLVSLGIHAAVGAGAMFIAVVRPPAPVSPPVLEIVIETSPALADASPSPAEPAPPPESPPLPDLQLPDPPQPLGADVPVPQAAAPEPPPLAMAPTPELAPPPSRAEPVPEATDVGKPDPLTPAVVERPSRAETRMAASPEKPAPQPPSAVPLPVRAVSPSRPPTRLAATRQPSSTPAPAPAFPKAAAPPAQAADAAPVTVSPGWRGAVAAWLAEHKTFPDEARRRGEEGRAIVRFTVGADGRVGNVELVRSSGSAILDRAVVAMLREASLPRFPSEMTQPDVTLTVGIQYTLAPSPAMRADQPEAGGRRSP